MVLLLAVLAGQSLRGSGPDTVAPPVLPAEPREVTVRNRDQIVTLTRSGDQWMVEVPEARAGHDVPGDAAAVNRLLDQIRSLPALPVVTSRGNIHEYGLTERVMRTVTVTGEDGEQLRLELGYSAAVGDAVYGRVGESPTVVRFPRALHHQVSTNPDHYRDMTVFSLAREEIRRITVSGAGPGIARDPEVTIEGAPDDLVDPTGSVPQERIRDLVRELESLTAVGFPREQRPVGADDGAGDPFAMVEIVTARGGRHEIALYPPDRERRFFANSSAVEYPFYLPEWRVRRLLLGIESYLEPFMEEPPPLMPPAM